MKERDTGFSYEAEIRALVGEARELVESLDDWAVNWRPSADRWSVAQNLDHVLRTGQLYLPPMEAAAAAARERKDRGLAPYRAGWIGAYMVRAMEPPPRPRVPTLKRLYPDQRHDGAALLGAFAAFHEELLALARRTGGDAWRHGRLRSPLLPLIRMTLAQAFAVLTAHGRRHLWQARQVTQAAGFPRPGAAPPERGDGSPARAD